MFALRLELEELLQQLELLLVGGDSVSAEDRLCWSRGFVPVDVLVAEGLRRGADSGLMMWLSEGK